MHDVQRLLRRAITVRNRFAIETNLVKVQQVIDVIREDPEIRDIRIIVGGNAFNRSPLSWKRIGADGYASDADSATKIALDWWLTGHESSE